MTQPLDLEIGRLNLCILATLPSSQLDAFALAELGLVSGMNLPDSLELLVTEGDVLDASHGL